MKEDDLYQKTHGNMIFPYICVGITSMALPSSRKRKMLLSRKNTPRGDISGITKKDDIHPGKYGNSAEIPY